MIYMITGETQERVGVGKQRDKNVREAGDCGPPVPPLSMNYWYENDNNNKKITLITFLSTQLVQLL